MKILYHHRTRSRDGQRIHIDGLMGALRRAGHDVTEVGPKLQEESSGQASGGAAAAWFLRPIRELAEIAYNLVEIRQLESAVRREQPEAIYSRHSLFAFAARWVARKHQLPWIVEVNAPLALERSNYGGLFWKRLASFLETWTLNAARQVIVVTSVMARYMEDQGVRPELLEVQFNGIDPARIQPPKDPDQLRESLGLRGKTVLGFVGYIRDWNRLERTYPFLKRRPETVLCVVGDGPDRERLRGLARDQGIEDQVRIVGAVPAEQVFQHVTLFDVALLPETTPYASPLKLLDYMAAGRAILAPDRPNIREVLSPGTNALLFDSAKENEFEEQLARLLDSPPLREQLGLAAKNSIDDLGLTWDHHATRVIEQFRGPAASASVAHGVSS